MDPTASRRPAAPPAVPPSVRHPAGPTTLGSIRATLVTYLLLIALVLVPFYSLVRPYLLALATGAVLGVLSYPLYQRLGRRLPRWAAALLVTVGVVVLVLVPVSALAVGAVRQGVAAVTELAQDGAPTTAGIVAAGRRWVPFLDAIASPAELEVMLKSSLLSMSEAASGVALGQLRAIPIAVLQLVLVGLSTYFSLVDGPSLVAWVGEKLPLSLHIRDTLADSFRSATRAVVLASIGAAGAQAAIILLGFWALGVPSALLAAGLTFVLGWVPALPMVVWGSATVYLYAQGSLPRAVLMIVVGVVVGAIDNVVRAVVLKGQRAIHPMVSLVAILGGIALFGITGVFIGPLVACMAIAVLEIWPAVASYCGIPVSGAGDVVPHIPMIEGDHAPSGGGESPDP